MFNIFRRNNAPDIDVVASDKEVKIQLALKKEMKERREIIQCLEKVRSYIGGGKSHDRDYHIDKARELVEQKFAAKMTKFE